MMSTRLGVKKLEGSEAEAVKSLLAALDAFREIRPTMPLQYVVTFLVVALEQGLSVGEYAERAGVSLSVMSRHLLDIGERNRHREKGFGLIDYRSHPEELRKHQVFLTPKGKTLLHRITRHLEG